MNQRPNICGYVLIGRGEIRRLELNEGAEENKSGKPLSEVEALITLRNMLEAEIINFEKREQRKFLNNPDAKDISI